MLYYSSTGVTNAQANAGSTTVDVTGMDMSFVKEDMTFHPTANRGYLDDAQPGYLIQSVALNTPGAGVHRLTLKAPVKTTILISTPFVVDGRGFSGSGLDLLLANQSRAINALQEVLGANVSLGTSKQLVLNRLADAAFGRLLFQKNGQDAFALDNAEVGGVNYLRLRYTPDGATWSDALTVRRDTGALAWGSSGGTTYAGDITISKAAPSITLNAAAAGQARTIFGQTAGVNRWGLQFGGSVAESGANAGSNFILTSYADAGTALRTDLTVTRSSGLWTLGGALTIAGILSGVTSLAMGGPLTGVTTLAASSLVSIGSNLNLTADGSLVYFGTGLNCYIKGTAAGPLVFGTAGNDRLTLSNSGVLSINTNVAATTSTTGTVVITGGLGVSGAIFAGTSVNAVTHNVTGPTGGSTARFVFQENGSQQWVFRLRSDISNRLYLLDADETNGGYWQQNVDAFTNLSDRRLKANARPIGVLARMRQDIKTDYLHEFDLVLAGGRRETGGIAQEVARTFPELVVKGDDGKTKIPRKQLRLDHPGLWGLQREKAGIFALQGVKELLVETTALRERLDRLEGGR